MSVTITSFKKACILENVSCKTVDTNESLVVITGNQKKHIILNSHLGLLSDTEWQLFRDKYYTYLLFGKDTLSPYTESYIDPQATAHFAPFVTYTTVEKIAQSIESSFTYPLVVKRNSGTQGQNVFICSNINEVIRALQAIYSKQQIEYDHVALVQQYVKPAAEYRIIILNSQFQFAYHKPHHRIDFGSTESAALITDTFLIDKMNALIGKLAAYFPLTYAGLDVIEDIDGRLWLLEINGSPTYSRFIDENGDERVIDLFRQVVRQLCMIGS